MILMKVKMTPQKRKGKKNNKATKLPNRFRVPRAEFFI